MVALLFYACAQRVRSSRAIERKCREDVAFMVITAMRVPDHSTIAEFRKRHERALAALFGDVLGLCREGGVGEGWGDRDRRYEDLGERVDGREPQL